MYKLFAFFYGVVIQARTSQSLGDAPVVDIVRQHLDYQAVPDLLALRDSGKTFVAEVEMEMGRRTPLMPQVDAELAQYPTDERIAAEMTLQQIDRACAAYIGKRLTADEACEHITNIIGKWTDPDAKR